MINHQDTNAIRSAVSSNKEPLWAFSALITLLALLALLPSAIRASDHADPLNLKDPEANITDLFFFPRGDQMILIFNVRRSLLNPKPYNLEPYEYVINMDFTTPVTFDNDSERARYGGTIAAPEKIHSDAAITVRLNNDLFEVDLALRGLEVRLRFDPWTLARVQVDYRGQSFGLARKVDRHLNSQLQGVLTYEK